MPNASPDIRNVVDAFRELDITIGNGLIGESQLLEPARRALFIGIGGTGNHALRRLKRIIHQRYKKIKESFAFIGIDTDLSSPKEDKDYMLLDESEKIKLTANEDYFDPKKRDRISDHIREWLNDDVMYAVKGDGAGAKRAVARALLFNSASEVANRFENIINNIRKGDDGSRIDVYILTGIGGGTGSGTLLDIAYMLRKILGGVSHTLYGFIFMPDINNSDASLPRATKESIVPNAFASLKELDYWMNIQSRDDIFVQKYSSNFEVSEKKPPFDYCWPMTATNAAGLYIKDALNQASTVAAEIICAWIAFKEDGTSRDNFVEAFASNVDDYRRTFLSNFNGERKDASRPVCFDYTICGASVAKLPVAAINTYLACVLFRKFSALYDRTFDEKIAEDLPKFCSDKSVSVDYNSIKNLLNSKYDLLGLKIPDKSDNSYSDLFESDAEKDYIYNLNKTIENVASVKMQIVEEKTRLLEMAFKEIFIDQNRGPYYLNSFIQSGNLGLISLFEGFKRNAVLEKGNLENREYDADREKNEKFKNGKKSIFIMRSSHIRDYSDALRRFYVLQRDKILCDACVEIYTELQERLQKRVSASYNATYGVLDALSGTFKKNIKTFDSAVNVQRNESTMEFSWDIFTLPEIVGIVTRTLNEKGVNSDKQTDLVKDLLVDLLDLIEKEVKNNSALADWNDVSLQKLDVNGFLANFVTNKFKDLTQKTLKEYLEIIALEKGFKNLDEYLEKQFKKMKDEATPLFNKPLSGAPALHYGTIPLDDPDIKRAWSNYAHGDPTSKAYPSVNSDTLVFITVGCAAPLYADKQLEEAEILYNTKMKDAMTNSAMRLVSATKMSRENGHKDELWDWRYLPSIIPADERPDNSLRTKDRDWEATCKAVVERLQNKKILRVNPATDKCAYMKITLDFDTVNKAVFAHGDVTSAVPAAELRKYKADLAELKSYIDGSGKAAPGIRQRFNVFFEVIESEFGAAVHPEWNDPNHEIITVYSRSLNIRRDLEKTENFFDALTAKINETDAVLSEADAAGKVAEQIVKGFLCGVFKTNGRQWQYMLRNGETEVLARGMGADKYPLHAMYEQFIKRAGYKEALTRIDEDYAAAIDGDALTLDDYKVFKEQFKNELERTKNDDAVSDAQRYFMDKTDGFIISLGI